MPNVCYNLRPIFLMSFRECSYNDIALKVNALSGGGVKAFSIKIVSDFRCIDGLIGNNSLYEPIHLEIRFLKKPVIGAVLTKFIRDCI